MNREEKIGAHVLDFARKCGWQDDGEGAFEYIQRISYAQGLEDRTDDPTKEDAARWRWIAPRFVGADFDWNEQGVSVLCFEIEKSFRISSDIDECVDVAIAASSAKEAGGRA